jgi:hypothetical protein
MEVATKMFDALFPAEDGELPVALRARFRQVLRLADPPAARLHTKRLRPTARRQKQMQQ